VALSSEELDAGLPRRALDRLGALPEAVREVPRVTRLWVRVLEAVDRREEADALLARLDRSRQVDGEVAHQLAGRARARGDAVAAIQYLRRAAELRPDLPSLALELARGLEGSGDGAGALAVLNELGVRMPDEPTVQAQLGKLLHRLGRRDEALGHLRAALALKPQDPELRRYTERVAAAAAGRDVEAPGEDLARRYATDAAALLPAAAKTPAPRRGEGTAAADPAIVLLDRRVVRVHRNGLSETFAQRVVQIETDRGAEDNKQFFVRYTPGVEEVEIRQARIFRRDVTGALQTLQASERDDQDLSEPWYGLYYDNRAEVVSFEGLRAGDVLEVQYLVADVGGQNMMADYFGDLQFIAEAIPKRRWEYTLIGPRSRAFHVNTPRLAGLEVGATDEGDDRVRRFAARDVPKIVAEPAMPGYAEVGPYLHLSTYASWADVGTWYWRLVVEQLAADETLRKTAHDAAPSRMTDENKVRAIHDLVVTGTRYVGLEFGIHGFKPYKVTQVLSRRFGDCKDKAALLVALLREVGIDAEMVLLRTRAGGRIETAPASLAVFDHAIVYVPRLDLYLDGTAEFSGTSELPSQDQGVMGLRVSARGATLVETPILPSSQNKASRVWTVEVSPTGAARVAETLVITGQAAPEWRQHYQTPGERLDRYAKVWSGRYPGANLVSVDMPGLGDRNHPVTVNAVASVPRLGQITEAGAFDLPVTVREADFSRTYARLSARKHDLVIAYPWQHEEQLTYRLPAGAHVQHLPAGRVAESAFGRFRLEVSAEAAGVVRVRSTLDITRHRLTPAEYAQFRQFLGDIDAALSDRIVVEKGPS
jgi:tetratricopeptide (TPR) repeat protein/transglutaminase-like putative cysteine protease